MSGGCRYRNITPDRNLRASGGEIIPNVGAMC
jgi:hypothetical protein